MEKQVPTREQTTAVVEFYIPRLTDSELRLLAAFARGLTKREEAGMTDTKRSIIAAVDHHMEDMDESELVMVLRFIHSLKDFR